jgi:type IV pilus assembly protein PilW
MLKHEQGYSLVSTMIGLTIGLMVAATALGTASFLEAAKRTSMGSNSALMNGAMALSRVESETRQAGLGLMYQNNFACPRMNVSYGDDVLLDGEVLYPASIVDGDDAPDTLSIAYLNSLTGATYARMMLPMTTVASILKLANAPDVRVGGVVLLQDVSPSNPCTLVGVSDLTVTDFGTNVGHTNGHFNSAEFSTPVLYSEKSRASASSSFVWSTFRVRRSTLEEVNNITGASTVIADGVVGFKVQYGITDGSGTTVSSWAPATGQYAEPAAADMLRVRAVRIGIVTRSPEKDSACVTKNGVFTLWPDGPTVDVTAQPNWSCYRYRTFNQVVPLVNVAMGLL